jgi:tRNA1(Val) A37 N6-methylase TrmN6
VDRLLGGRVVLHQAVDGYRAAIDPVLLAAAVPARGGERACDLGCGDGAAMLCLATRVPGLTVVGLERDGRAAARARAGCVDSGVADRTAVVEGDVAHLPDALAPGSFDHVLVNPPFHPAEHTASPDPRRHVANREARSGLEPWVTAAHRLLKPKGRFVLIHRADRLDRVIAGLAPRFGSIAIIPIWPRAGRDAKRVVLVARKGGRGPAALRAGLVLHGEATTYTEAATAVLRDAAPLA